MNKNSYELNCSSSNNELKIPTNTRDSFYKNFKKHNICVATYTAIQNPAIQNFRNLREQQIRNERIPKPYHNLPDFKLYQTQLDVSSNTYLNNPVGMMLPNSENWKLEGEFMNKNWNDIKQLETYAEILYKDI